MAEGGDYDPTTEKTPLISKKGDDDDDDGINWETPIVLVPDEPDRTQPFEPGGASTPYPEGESIAMTERTSLPQESGPPDSIPTVSELDYIDEEEREGRIERVKNFIKDKFPKVDFAELGPIGLGKKPEKSI